MVQLNIINLKDVTAITSFKILNDVTLYTLLDLKNKIF